MTQQPAVLSALRLLLALAAMLVASYAIGQAELGAAHADGQLDLVELVSATFGEARASAASGSGGPMSPAGIHWSRTSSSPPVNASALDLLLLILALAALLGLVSWRRMERVGKLY